MNILKDAEDYLIKGGLAKQIRAFRNPTLEEQKMLWIDYKKKTDARQYFNPRGGEFESDVVWEVSFNSKLRETLSTLTYNTKKLIKDVVTIAQSQNLDLNPLEVDFTKFYSQTTKTGNPFAKYKEVIEPFLIDIHAFLISQRENLKRDIEERRQLKIDGFGFRRNRNALKDIYENLLVNGRDHFIDRTVELHVFIEAMTSKDFGPYRQALKFGCDNEYAAAVLHELQYHCSNFTYEMIGSSEVFITKKGSLLKSNSIRSALHKARLSGKGEDYIASFFKRFNRAYK